MNKEFTPSRKSFSWQFTGNFTSDSMYETFATYLAHKILEIPPAVTARFEV